MEDVKNIIQETSFYCANNYDPLKVVIERGEGVWVYDIMGNKYLDMLSAYSAVNQGHRHPHIIKALIDQASRLTLTSRAMHNDKMGSFLKKICELAGYEKAIPMNTGSEAVETALKIARKWGYLNKRVPADKAEIIACSNNFHGRTITIISLSTEDQYKSGFGPLTPGFKIAEYGSTKAVSDLITPNTVAVLAEPIQGEGGVIVPPEGYLNDLRKITMENNILLMFDEIQTGLGRTGRMFAYMHEDAKPDVLILGKALGGGVYPVSAVLADNDIMCVFNPGDHGSTFGGNPLAANVGIAALDVIVNENLPERAASLGEYFMRQLNEIDSPCIKEIRGKGLFIGVEIEQEYGAARIYCDKLMGLGILCKDTHAQTIRFAPPLVITKEEIDWAMERIRCVFE